MSIELNKLIKMETSPSIVFIYGAEEFLIEQYLFEYLNKFFPDRDKSYNFNKFHSDEIPLSNLLDYCNSYSMLSDSNVVLIKDFQEYFKGRAKKKDPILERLIRYINEPSEDTVFIITCYNEDLVKGKAKVSAEPYKSLLEKVFCISIPKIYPSNYNTWIRDEFSKRGKSISEKGIYLILTQTQQNLRDIYNQIEKIDAYFLNSSTIPDDEIADLIGQSREFNVFELQKSVSKRDIHTSLEICQSIMKSSDSAIAILSILFTFFKNLLKYYELSSKSTNKFDLARLVGVNPYFLDDYAYASKRYNYLELEEVFIILCDYDRIMKTSSPNSMVLMTELLVKIIGAK
jgi:DNA polymerase-3 subunit delta